jgi:type II secretory pathway pseudopilin PulG
VQVSVRDEGGYSLIEMVVVCMIMGTVLAGIGQLFTSGMHSQQDLTARFQAQVQLNTALGKLRREVHGACSIRAGYTTSAIVLNMPGSLVQPPNTPCDTPTAITWCTIGSGTRFKLYRVAGTTCTATGAKVYADFLTSGAVFTSYTAEDVVNEQLAKLHVHFPVNVKGKTGKVDSYTIDDDIILRNSSLT